MEFKKYTSIENSYRIKFLEYVKEKGYDKETYTVTEKIHGANFSIWYNGEHFRFAKRSKFLGNESDFYSYKTATKELIDKIKEVYNKSPICKGQILTLYGELFGGTYPHPDVERCDVKQVQKGVYYSPTVGFYCFDVAIDGRVQPIDALQILKEHDILTAEILYEGSLDECLQYSNEFQTTIPEKLGLPAIENNICEGVVIKSACPLYLGNGSRVILKNKNEKWTEKTKKEKKARVEVKLNANEQRIFDNFAELINENRLRNVISHIGTISQKDFGKLMGAYSKDVHDDFMKDYEADYDNMEKPVREKIKKSVNRSCADLIRKHFLNIIDGVF